MATILTRGTGEHTRRCDATCHTAKGMFCDCICLGRYHGKGSSDAARELLRLDVEAGVWGADTRGVAIALHLALEDTTEQPSLPFGEDS